MIGHSGVPRIIMLLEVLSEKIALIKHGRLHFCFFPICEQKWKHPSSMKMDAEKNNEDIFFFFFEHVMLIILLWGRDYKLLNYKIDLFVPFGTQACPRWEREWATTQAECGLVDVTGFQFFRSLRLLRQSLTMGLITKLKVTQRAMKRSVLGI